MVAIGLEKFIWTSHPTPSIDLHNQDTLQVCQVLKGTPPPIPTSRTLTSCMLEITNRRYEKEAKTAPRSLYREEHCVCVFSGWEKEIIMIINSWLIFIKTTHIPRRS